MRAHAGHMVATFLSCGALLACNSSPARTAVSSQATTTSSSTVAAAEPTTSAPPSTTAVQGPVVAPTTTATAAAPVATTVPVTEVPAGLDRVGSAGQAILVTAGSYGATTATFTAYEWAGGAWHEAFGPWTARVGYNGLAPPGTKREGDGRTPSGVYGFQFMFGVTADPGVNFSYRQVTPSIVWVDDPDSPLYNQWVDRNEQDPGAGVEEMYQPMAYAYGAVIAYNTAATPGLGSAIFLHASTGGATAGCVSLPVSQLVEVLRWLDPSRSPRIVMSVE